MHILSDPGANGSRALYDRGHRLDPTGSSAAPLGARLTYTLRGKKIDVGLWFRCPNLYHVVPEVQPQDTCAEIRQKCESFLEELKDTATVICLQDEFLTGFASPERLQKIFRPPWIAAHPESDGGPS